MKLNSISIGGGLALVAVGLLANAAASLVGSPERTANADDLKRAAKSPQSVADAPMLRANEMRRAMDGTPPTMPMGGGDGCVEGEPLNWFGEIRELPECSYSCFDGSCRYDIAFVGFESNFTSMGLHGARRALDVDSDGAEEFVVGKSRMLVLEGNPSPDECLLYLEDLAVDEGGAAFRKSCVLDTNALREYAIGAAGSVNYYNIFCGAVGWRDMDLDGDYDLLVAVVGRNYAGDQVLGRVVWLENTGFEKQAYAAGDINKDGVVDGVDISILLSDWSY